MEEDGGVARAMCGGGDRGKWTDLGWTVEAGLIGFINELIGRSVKTSENQNDFFAPALGPGRYRAQFLEPHHAWIWVPASLLDQHEFVKAVPSPVFLHKP